MAYWLDADVLIHAARGPYRFKMIPQFWGYLHKQIVAGVVMMPRINFEEIVESGYDDDLATWCRARKKTGLCKNETKAVQEAYVKIATHVQEKESRKPQQIREFLAGGDGWLIASAMATNGTVVTMENEFRVKGKIKIPNVCKPFDVKCLSLSQLLELLDPDLSGEREE